MDINLVFENGISFTDFVDQDNDTYRESTLEIFNKIQLSDDEIERIKSINKRVKILVCAEIWCPDCMINVPVIEKMRLINDNITISIVDKEQFEELHAIRYPSENLRIPTFIFFDEEFNELGKFVEHPKLIRELTASSNQVNLIITKRKYKKGQYTKETLKDILGIII